MMSTPVQDAAMMGTTLFPSQSDGFQMQPAVCGSRGVPAKPRLEWDSTMLEDLRTSFPLSQLTVLEQRFKDNLGNPALPPTWHPGFGVSRSPVLTEREAQWHFWFALADTGLLTEEVAFTTESHSHANWVVGIGAAGQFVVHTKIGAVLWMPRTRRMYSPNARMDLLRHLAIRFQAFAVCTDDSTFAGRWPATAPATTPPPSGAPTPFSFQHE